MMKHIFPVLVIASMMGLLFCAATDYEETWALLPIPFTVVIGLTAFSAINYSLKPDKA